MFLKKKTNKDKLRNPPGDRLLAAGAQVAEGPGWGWGAHHVAPGLWLQPVFIMGPPLPPSSRPGSQGLSLSGLSIEQTACLLLGRRGTLAVWVRKTSQGEVGDLKAPFTDFQPSPSTRKHPTIFLI